MSLSFFDLILNGAALSIGWHVARAVLGRAFPSLMPRQTESVRLVVETDTDAPCLCPDCTADREEGISVH